MILRMPEYCRDFKCIADKCRDSCCIGWEIDIDDAAADYYENTGGDFGERLRRNITDTLPKSFILGENERCPFLNERNLCDIIINLGEEHLCRICSDHPRYFEWFGGVKEGGIGLCCEEASRIILLQTKPLSFWDSDVPDETSDEFDTELYNCLFAARKKIIAHLEKDGISLGQRICDVLAYAAELQENTDNGDFSVPEIMRASHSEKQDFRSILEFFLALEPLDNNWMPYLRECIGRLEDVVSEREAFEKKNPAITGYMQNIAVYFVWRYFLKGAFDGEFLSRIKLMAVSVAVIGYLFACKWLEQGNLTLNDCAEIAKNYSKEIEYCEENLDALADASYEERFFSAGCISGMFLN